MKRFLLTLVLLGFTASALAEPEPMLEPLPTREMPLSVQAAFLYPILFDVVTAGAPSGGASNLLANTWIANQTFNDDVSLIFGTGADANIEYDTAQTPDSWMLGVGQDSRTLWLREKADTGDYALAQQTNPTFAIHSAATTANQYISFAHNQTDGVIDVGTGSILLSDAALAAAGTVGAPGIAWSADSDGTGTGFYRRSANIVSVAVNGVAQAEIQNGYTVLAAAQKISWGTIGVSLDTYLSREAAAVAQLGEDVNGAAVAQTLKAHDGITGTDVAGANFTLAGGRGTGAGAPGRILFQTATALGTGTTAQTLATGLAIEAGGTVSSGASLLTREFSGSKSNITEGSAQAIVRIALPDGGMYGATVFYTVSDSDGTDHVARTGSVKVQGAKKTGVDAVCTINTAQDAESEDGSQIVNNAGAFTLTYTWTNVVSTTNCDLSLNAASSAGADTYDISYKVVLTGNSTSTTITAQ